MPFDLLPHLPLLERYALVLTRDRDQARDLVQQTLVRALGAAATWRVGSDPRPWLLSILHNLHVSQARHEQVRRRHAETLAAELAATSPVAGPAPQDAQVELGQTLEAMLGLPEEQREILILSAVEGLTYLDIAQVLGVPLGTVMSRLSRARAALRAVLATRRARRPGGGPRLRLVE